MPEHLPLPKAVRNPDKCFWEGKRVLVTGNTGFKGSWLSLMLSDLGAEVLGFSSGIPTTPSLFQVLELDRLVHYIEGEIRDLASLSSVVQSFQPQILFHLAAQSLVITSYANPLDTFAINSLGTANVLEAIRSSSNLRAAIIVTSDKCYKNDGQKKRFVETDPLGGHDPYSSSKACAELMTESYRNSFFSRSTFSQHRMALASARAGNVIGGGDWADNRLIPDIVRHLEAGQAIPIRNPDQVRPWQHVLEPLSGYMLLAENLFLEGPPFDEAWNFGPIEDNARSVQYVADFFASRWTDCYQVKDERRLAHLKESHYLDLCHDKARNKLRWFPRWDLTTTLDKTVEWYKANHGHMSDLLDLTRTQISSYYDTSVLVDRIPSGNGEDG